MFTRSNAARSRLVLASSSFRSFGSFNASIVIGFAILISTNSWAGPKLPQPQPQPPPAQPTLDPDLLVPPTCAPVTVSMPEIAVPRLFPFEGKTDIGGRYEVTVDVELSARGKFAVAEGYVQVRALHAKGTKSAGREFRAYFQERHRVIAADSQCSFVLTSTHGQATGVFADEAEHNLSGTGALSSARCLGDSPGGDINRLWCRNLRFQPFEAPTQERVFGHCGTQTVVVRPHPVSVWVDHKLRGDSDLLVWPATLIQTGIRGSNEVVLETRVLLQQRHDDETWLEGRTREVIFSIDETPGCAIESVSPRHTYFGASADGTRDRIGYPSEFSGSPTKLMERARCVSDVFGPDTGKVSCSAIEFREVTITLRPDPNDLI